MFLLSTATKTHQSLNLLCSHVTFFSSFEGLYARIWQVKKNRPFILIWLLYLSELFLNHFFYFTFFPFIVLVLYFNCSSFVLQLLFHVLFFKCYFTFCFQLLFFVLFTLLHFLLSACSLFCCTFNCFATLLHILNLPAFNLFM